MLLIYIILVFSNLLLPSHAFGLLRVATLLPPHQKNNLLDNDWSALTNPTYSKSTSGEKNFDKDIAELPKGPVVNDWNLNHGPKIGKDDTDKCYCNYPEELCDGEDFCIKHRNAACFHSISEHVNAETQNIDTVHSYGCAPLESGSDASHFTCNAYRAIHSNPTSIVCCYEGSYCNFNITPPAPLRRQFIDINPPNILGALFDFDEHPIRAWLVTSLAIFIAFSFVVVCIGGASKVVKSIYLAQRNADIRKTSPLYLNCLDAKNTNVVVDNSLLIVPTNDYLEYSSGSGSQQACLNQRTIALDLEMDISVSKGRFGEVHRAKYRGSYVAVKTFYTTVEDSWKNEKEIYLTQMFNHENILQFIAADIGSVDSITKMLLITDYHDLGSLYDYLQNDNGICIREGLNLAVTSASGLEHLHRAIHGTGSRIKPEIAHRDIKSKNIIVKRQGVCCIADFGMAIKNDEYISQTVATIKIKVGTKRYMAPELLRESLNKYDFESFKQSDIYSFALVLWEIGQKINDTEFQINNTHSSKFIHNHFDSSNKTQSSSGIGSMGDVNHSCHHSLAKQYIPETIIHNHTSSNSEFESSGDGTSNQESGASSNYSCAEPLLKHTESYKCVEKQNDHNFLKKTTITSYPYTLPYQGMVPSDPSFDDMYGIICLKQIRPDINPNWNISSSIIWPKYVAIMRGSWTQQPHFRHSALKIKKELIAISEMFDKESLKSIKTLKTKKCNSFQHSLERELPDKGDSHHKKISRTSQVINDD